MFKSRHGLPGLADLPNRQEENGEGSLKKKKKKKRRQESQEEGENELTSPIRSLSSLSSLDSPSKKKKKRRQESQEEGESELTSPIRSLSSLSSLDSPSKKKKKKKKRIKEELDVRLNGIIDREEEEEERGEGRIKKRKKKTEEEEEADSKKKKKREKVVVEEESDHKKKKKMKEERKERMEEEEEEEEEKGDRIMTKKKAERKEKNFSLPGITKEEWKVEVEEEEVDTEMDEESVWSQDATQMLLSQVALQLPPPSRDTRSCRVTLKNVDWEAAAVSGHSPTACQEHFMALYKKINPYKNLTTVVEEMGKLAESGLSDRRNRPTLPIHRFLRDFFTPKMKDAAKKKGENMFKLGHKAWKELPAALKEDYLRSYREDCSKVDSGKDKGPIRLPKLPYQLCWDAEKPVGFTRRSRTYYSSLTPSKQVPYIRQSLEDMMRYTVDLDAHLASHPEYEPPPCHTITKIDLKTYLDAHGCPVMPPLRPAQAFYQEVKEKGQLEEVPGLKRMAKALTIYKDLSQEEKNNYRLKVEQWTGQFEEDLEEWSKEQDTVTMYAFKKYRELVPYSKQMGQKKTRYSKIDNIFTHKAPAITSCPKFLGEPLRPPASAYRLFIAKFRTSADPLLSSRELQTACQDGWKSLADQEKGVYISRARALHKQYEEEVKEYVRAMDSKTRILYLGFNRLPLYRFFGNRDVFEDEFPNSEEYPVLLKGQPASPAKHHSPSHVIKEEEEDEDEAEEEEEEEMIFVLPPTKKSKTKRLSPLIFSSLSEVTSPMKELKRKATATTTTTTAAAAASTTTIAAKKSKAATRAPPTHTKKKMTSAGILANVRKKSKIPPPPPPPPPPHDSDDDTDDDDDSDDSDDGGNDLVTPTWHSPYPASFTAQPKKSKAPQPYESDDTDSEEEEVEVTPAWRSPPPPPAPSTTQAKKKPAAAAAAAATANKKSKVSPAPPPNESTDEESEEEYSEEEEEEVTPAWRSGPPTPISASKPKKQQEYSSSSGFSDSDSSY